MNIGLRTQGGFTGPAGAVVRQIDTDELPEPSRKEVLQLVTDAKLSARPKRAMRSPPRPQDLHYTLQVSGDGDDHILEFHVDAVDEPLRKLVEWIEDEVPPKSAFKPR